MSLLRTKNVKCPFCSGAGGATAWSVGKKQSWMDLSRSDWVDRGLLSIRQMSLVCPPRSENALASCCVKATCLVPQQGGRNLVGLGPTDHGYEGLVGSPHSPAAEPSVVLSTVCIPSSPSPAKASSHRWEVTLKEWQ